ncbi:DNA ligase 4 [Onthophagus taurus]|uniref:DNA ligase 4 n=1 Tax=Onthophagus taurus TaxID=166361 RepID=UPI000C1FE446|nr:DNA ligase 4 [Onthophagus taurus]
MSNINFKDFCNVLEDIKTNKNRDYKIKTLQLYYSNLRKNITSTTNLHPILRLLLPSFERNRSYGMKEDTLKRKIIKILSLTKDSGDSKILNNKSGDFSTTAFNVLRKYYDEGKLLNIGQVNEALDEIAAKNNDECRLGVLFKKTSPFEQKWIIRIILKDLKLGLSDKKMLNLYHPDAVDLFDKTNDLEHVCVKLFNPNERLNEINVALFNAFCPMLSKRCDVKELFKTVPDDKSLFYVENKFDGERFQLHMNQGSFKYFSRRGFDFTAKFGCNYKNGIFTPLLRNCFINNTESVILDGEMMGWDPVKKIFGSKGMNFDVKNLTDTSYHQPCFCVFDILLLNNEVLTNKALRERKKLLESILTPIEGVILVSSLKEVYGKREIINALNDSASNKEEGIVFKRPDSFYITNSRNDGWWKMKLEYFSDVMTDLDVIIMGGFTGKNQQIEKVLVGVGVPSKRGSHPTVFHSLSTVYTGLNLNEWKELKEKLNNKLFKTSENNSFESFGLIFGKKKPDVWVKPEDSFILEVRASELIKTKAQSDYKSNYTLRFPRIQKLRFDKPYYDCLTTLELENLTSTQLPVEKLFKRKLNLEDLEYDFKKTKKIRVKYTVNEVNVDNVISNIFNNLEFCVWTGNNEYSKEDIEKILKENGGKVTKIESQRTFCILIGDKHERVNYYRGDIDIVKLSWVLNLVEKKKFFDYTPLDTIYATNKTKNVFMEKFDKFGDSFTEELTIKKLKAIEKNINGLSFFIRPLPKEIDKFCNEIQANYNLSLFQNYVAFFYQFSNNSKLDELEFKFWGGRISNKLDDSVNLVIVDSIEKIDEVKMIFKGKIVLKDFINQSINKYTEDLL